MNTALIATFALGLALTLIAFRNAKNQDLFSFQFLFPAVTVAFVLVEFSDFILNAGVLYEVYSDSGVMNIALFMLVSCSFAALLGYNMAARSKPTLPASSAIAAPKPSTMRYMHYASIVLGLISFGAFLGLANLGGGLWQYIFYSGSYSIEWRGLPVYLIFLVRLCYVSIVIQLWLWVRTKKLLHLQLAVVFSIIPLINVLFLFRRSEIIKLGVFYGYFLTNYRGLKIGRAASFAAILLMYLAFKVFPFLRDEGGKDAEIGDLIGGAIAARDTYENSEIGSGLLRIYHSVETGLFEYGAIFYNALVKQFVPAGLVGAETKAALLLPTVEYADTSFAAFRFYVSPMGFAQAYQQFWLLGGLIFFVIGALMAKFEQNRFKGARHEIFFVLLIPAAVSTVSADLSFFVPQLIIYLVVVGLCVPATARTVPQVRLRTGRSTV